jgi:DNA-binding transcriptional ArsR family regulator
MTDRMAGPQMLPSEVLSEAAACLRIMAHPLRLRIVDILLQRELAVHEIADLCGVRPHQVCEHLRLMQTGRLLSSRRDGRSVYYAIASPHLPSLIHCIRANCKTEE